MNIPITDLNMSPSLLTTVAAQNAAEEAWKNMLLMDAKQRDYGSKNISGFGLYGVLVRMNDKFERLKRLTLDYSNPTQPVLKLQTAQNESVEDTLRDISNYAIIALLLLSNRWPQE